jgi:hypothetical protein
MMFVALATLAFAQIDPAHKQTLTLYHETQPEFQALGLKNQDTGDIFGDLYFVLRSVSLPVECRSKNPLAKFDCDNPEQNDTATNVISQNTVDVDSRFGIYGTCNVDEKKKTYSCECRLPNQKTAPCNGTVGRSNIYDREHAPKGKGEDWQWWRVNLARKMGGSAAGGAWFSTVTNGECASNTTSKGKARAAEPCYWSLTATTRTIASSCLLDHVSAAVVAHNATCFNGCSQPKNQSSVCYVECFMGNVLGPDGGEELIDETAGIPLGVVSGAWNGAFAAPASGGCPELGAKAQQRGAQGASGSAHDPIDSRL